MLDLSRFTNPISNLLRTVRENSLPNADRMRRKARRLDRSACRDLAKYSKTNSRRRSLLLLARARGKQEEAIQLRQDADRIGPKGKLPLPR